MFLVFADDGHLEPRHRRRIPQPALAVERHPRILFLPDPLLAEPVLESSAALDRCEPHVGLGKDLQLSRGIREAVLLKEGQHSQEKA